VNTLRDLTSAATAFRDARDWKQFHGFKEMFISLQLEASELLEHAQWETGAELDRKIRREKEAIADELSDVLYWVLLIADDLQVDLNNAFHEKLKKSAEKYPVEKSRGSALKYTKLP
jgi:NTP pyrophosphatase (non-canonical NTP hydrolase)